VQGQAFSCTRSEGVLALSGELAFAALSERWDAVRRLAQDPTPVGTLDLSEITRAEGGALALVVSLRDELRRQGSPVELRGARPKVGEVLSLYDQGLAESLRAPPQRESVFVQAGRAVTSVANEVWESVTYLGQLTHAFLETLRNPRSVQWGRVPTLMERHGADGFFIVILISFLVGFTMAFQGATQLKRFGANIYVADLVGLAITREMGPLMTAIIVCGRSGAAFAAELGTMKVSEEIDALRTLGFDPLRFLVIPRMVALVVVLPMLTIFADLVGMLGGLLVGLTSLDLTFVAYLNQTRRAIGLWDVASGLLKSGVFALTIAFISCQQGLSTSGGAQGVGKSTTRSVVMTLFALIAINAVFALVFAVFDL